MTNHEALTISSHQPDYLSADIFYSGETLPAVQKMPPMIAKHVVEVQFIEPIIAIPEDYDEVDQIVINDNAIVPGQAREINFTHPYIDRTPKISGPKPAHTGHFSHLHQQ